MSRILRRPMFRGGGKVSSYGNGIASGLGYAGGGRINLRVGGNPAALVNLGGGGAAPTQSTIGGNILNKNVGRMSGMATKGANLLKSPAFSEAGIMNAIKNYGPKVIDKTRGIVGGAIKRFPAISFGLAGEYLTRPQDVDKVIYEQEGYGPIEGRMRQIFDPTYTSKMMKVYEQGFDDEGTLNASIKESKKDGLSDAEAEAKRLQDELYKLRTAQAYGNPTEEPSSPGLKETVVDKKARLEKTAKEYEDILGAGIKKDSIFDAMVEGGARLYAGEGPAAALIAANKALDPIQNIKTASRKLAVEEDVAIRKALAVAKGKRTATGELLDFYKNVKDDDGKRVFSDVEIAEKLDKGSSKSEKLIKYKEGLGVGPGFKEYVKDEYGPQVKFFDVDVEKVDFENVEDGVYYQPPTGKLDKYKDKFITVKDGKVTAVNARTR